MLVIHAQRTCKFSISAKILSDVPKGTLLKYEKVISVNNVYV